MIEQIRTRIGQATVGFSAGQKVAMGAAFVAIVGGLWFFSQWASTPEMAPLFTDLETTDAAAISEELDSAGVAYELADRGRTILVPRDQVYEIRLDMSSAGLPDGGSQGYSLLDEQGITSTQFQQRVAFQRALEGELAATIRSIDAIDAATVHLVIPREDLFAGDDIEATASVLVQTSSTLAPTQVQAIVNLVAGSVEGLDAESVTVADQTGLVLAAPGQDAFTRAGLEGAQSQTRGYESDLADRIEEMLAAVVGPGNAMVTVSADMEWDRSSIVRETHTPSEVGEGEERLKSAESIRTESYAGTDAGEAGVLGGEDATDTDGDTSYSLSDIDTQYVNDTEVRTTESTGGDVNRLNVAVLVDEASIGADEVGEIESVVASAAGIDRERGDTLVVSRLAFDNTIEDAIATELEEAAVVGEQAEAGDMIRNVVLGVLALLIVLIALVQLWRGRADKEEVEELDLTALTSSLTAGMARPAAGASAPLVSAIADAASDDSAAPAATATPADDLRAMVDNQPDEVARLLRTWLADRRAVAR